MKNLIATKSLKSPINAVAEALKASRKAHQTGLNTIIFSDLDISALEQLELLRKIKSEWPKLQVIFSGQAASVDEVIALFRGGLADYLPSPASEEDIGLSIQRFHARGGGAKFNPAKFNLTKREFQVCKLLVEGFSSKNVAERLSISPATVKVHKSRVMHKLNVATLPDLVRLVLS